LQKVQEEAERKVNKEIKAHAETKHKLQVYAAEEKQARQAADDAFRNHMDTKEKLEKEQRQHTKTVDALQAAKDDVTSMRLQMDAMKVEMEAQRKSFVINVNWAARCTELKTKYDHLCGEMDTLLEKHVKVKSEMDEKLRGQEEYRMKSEAADSAYARAEEQIGRQAAEIATKGAARDEVAMKLAELEEFKAKAAEEEVKKKLGSQNSLAVLQRSLAKGEEGFKTSAFSGWATITKAELKKKMQKDRAMKRALKTISSEGMGLCSEVYKAWRDDVEAGKRAALLAASKRLAEASGSAGSSSMAGRQRAIAQLEKQFVGEDVALTKSCFQGWALGQVARKKKEQNHKKASRMISNSANGALAEVIGLWNDLTEKTRKKKRQHEANLHKAGRFIANNSKMLLIDVVQYWWGMIEGIRHERKAKEAGTAKAMRMLSNSASSLQNLVFDYWAKIRGESKKKDQGNKKALRIMADSAQALVIAVWQSWKGSQQNSSAKSKNTAKAVRMINASGEALQAACYQSWAKDCSKNKDKNKKIRALEKSFGAQDIGLKMVVFTGWQSFAKIEGRKKRAKEHSMKSAVKSITGNRDLLLCQLLLAWARYASGDRKEKLAESTAALEEQLKTAVEEARVAVEEDLVKAKAEVERITTELEATTAERDAEIAKMPILDSELETSAAALAEFDKQVETFSAELNHSKKAAKTIGEELSKVGIFIEAHSPKKGGRGGTGGKNSRPGSGNEKLPALSRENSRPNSGTNGSKSARGVAGERGPKAY